MLDVNVEADLRLEILQPKHVNIIFRLVNENRAHLRRWMPWVESTKSKSDISKFISMTYEQYRKNLGPNRAIFYRDNFCGITGFKPIDQVNKIGQVGYWLDQSYQGLGLITKSTGMIVREGFEILSLNRIEIHCAVDNIRSQNVAKRLGFQQEAVLREHEWLNDRFVDVMLFSLLKREYIKQSSQYLNSIEKAIPENM